MLTTEKETRKQSTQILQKQFTAASPVKFCHLRSISCHLLHFGLHYEPSSRQGDLVFAASYSCYVAYCYKTFWQGCSIRSPLQVCLTWSQESCYKDEELLCCCWNKLITHTHLVYTEAWTEIHFTWVLNIVIYHWLLWTCAFSNNVFFLISEDVWDSGNLLYLGSSLPLVDQYYSRSTNPTGYNRVRLCLHGTGDASLEPRRHSSDLWTFCTWWQGTTMVWIHADAVWIHASFQHMVNCCSFVPFTWYGTAFTQARNATGTKMELSRCYTVIVQHKTVTDPKLAWIAGLKPVWIASTVKSLSAQILLWIQVNSVSKALALYECIYFYCQNCSENTNSYYLTFFLHEEKHTEH